MSELEEKAAIRAVRSLELALHPNTSDAEVLAGIEGWRRLTSGDSLEKVCRALWDDRSTMGMTLADYQADWQTRFNDQAAYMAELKSSNVGLHREMSQLAAALKSAQDALTIQESVIANLREKKPEKVSAGVDLKNTDILYARFGDVIFNKIGWNKLRRTIIFTLLAEGITLKDMSAYLPCVTSGERTGSGFTYYAEHGISVKTRDNNESYRDLRRAAQTLNRHFSFIVMTSEKHSDHPATFTRNVELPQAMVSPPLLTAAE